MAIMHNGNSKEMLERLATEGWFSCLLAQSISRTIYRYYHNGFHTVSRFLHFPSPPHISNLDSLPHTFSPFNNKNSRKGSNVSQVCLTFLHHKQKHTTTTMLQFTEQGSNSCIKWNGNLPEQVFPLSLTPAYANPFSVMWVLNIAFRIAPGRHTLCTFVCPKNTCHEAAGWMGRRRGGGWKKKKSNFAKLTKKFHWVCNI